VFAQWTVYAAKNEARSHTALGLALVGIIGAAIVNAQAYIYARMKLPILGKNPTAYNTMFYAITGAFLLLMIIGIGFTLVTAFRYAHAHPTAIALVTSGAVDIDRIVTGRFGLDRAAEAVQAPVTDPTHLKVVVTP